MTAPGRSFGAAAADYERGRPGYPADAVAWMVGASPLAVVADVGAGTGKLTRALVAAGHGVIAVDPDPQMLAALAAAVPEAGRVEGTAERLPLAAQSADAVVLGQAWHWVDVAEGSAEIARVLRPGGTLGLVWNIRDESVPWVAELTKAMHGSAAERLLAGDGPRVGAPFPALEERSWSWVRTMAVSDLQAMVRSRSYYLEADAHRRAVIDEAVLRIGSAVARDGTIDLPYVTRAFRTTRP
ncbi:class I SAM-dependent methyltransferase [Demequina sp. NBRC 110056]|uniref:class I SAM-dependent methyltransferase n=1 Tax=Demequina sp. NBRC 110056 TaxID=1570345 RepID=UPI001F30CD56|nr:class I SAM-dependent methyltransferase [Demequina sp. NBRC 110056]